MQKAAWSAAAHLGSPDMSALDDLLPVRLPTLSQLPFQRSGDGWRPGTTRTTRPSYLKSEAELYNHPNATIEPRIPGIFQYYSIR